MIESNFFLAHFLLLDGLFFTNSRGNPTMELRSGIKPYFDEMIIFLKENEKRLFGNI